MESILIGICCDARGGEAPSARRSASGAVFLLGLQPTLGSWGLELQAALVTPDPRSRDAHQHDAGGLHRVLTDEVRRPGGSIEVEAVPVAKANDAKTRKMTLSGRNSAKLPYNRGTAKQWPAAWRFARGVKATPTCSLALTHHGLGRCLRTSKDRSTKAGAARSCSTSWSDNE